MQKFTLLFVFLITINLNANAQFKNLLNKAKEVLTEDSGSNIGLGLKEALEVGTSDAVASLSTANGYFDSPYKILIPEEAQKVVKTISKVPGFRNVEKDLLAKMNEAAEIAAKKATPILVNSIKSMSFSDAKNILLGEQNAATVYLEDSSRESIHTEFLPVIQSALDEVKAREYWRSVVIKYNKLPLTKDVNPELDNHVSQKALDGLFALIAEKELGIRNDVNQRSSPLLKEVFAMQDE